MNHFDDRTKNGNYGPITGSYYHCLNLAQAYIYDSVWNADKTARIEKRVGAKAHNSTKMENLAQDLLTGLVSDLDDEQKLRTNRFIAG
jgi:hypothetical protein